MTFESYLDCLEKSKKIEARSELRDLGLLSDGKTFIRANIKFNSENILRLKAKFSNTESFLEFLASPSFVKSVKLKIIDGVEFVEIKFYDIDEFYFEYKDKEVLDFLRSKGIDLIRLANAIKDIGIDCYYMFLFEVFKEFTLKELTKEGPVVVKIHLKGKEEQYIVDEILFIEEDGNLVAKREGIHNLRFIVDEGKITNYIGIILEGINNEIVISGGIPVIMTGILVKPHDETLANAIIPKTYRIFVFCSRISKKLDKCHLKIKARRPKVSRYYDVSEFKFGELSERLKNLDVDALYCSLKEEDGGFHYDFDVHIGDAQNFEELERRMPMKRLAEKCEGETIDKFCLFVPGFENLFKFNMNQDNAIFLPLLTFGNKKNLDNIKVLIIRKGVKGLVATLPPIRMALNSIFVNLGRMERIVEFCYEIGNDGKYVHDFLIKIRDIFKNNPTIEPMAVQFDDKSMVLLCMGKPMLEETVGFSSTKEGLVDLSYVFVVSSYEKNKSIESYLKFNLSLSRMADNIFRRFLLGNVNLHLNSRGLAKFFGFNLNFMHFINFNGINRLYSSLTISSEKNDQVDNLQSVLFTYNFLNRFPVMNSNINFQLTYARRCQTANIRNIRDANVLGFNDPHSYISLNAFHRGFQDEISVNISLKMPTAVQLRHIDLVGWLDFLNYRFNSRNFGFKTHMLVFLATGPVLKTEHLRYGFCIGMIQSFTAFLLFDGTDLNKFIRLQANLAFGLKDSSLMRNMRARKMRYFYANSKEKKGEMNIKKGFVYVDSENLVSFLKLEPFSKSYCINRSQFLNSNVYEIYPTYSAECQFDAGLETKLGHISIGLSVEALFFDRIGPIKLNPFKPFLIYTPFTCIGLTIMGFDLKILMGYNITCAGDINFENIVLRLYF